jgi:hypothetical protein
MRYKDWDDADDDHEPRADEEGGFSALVVGDGAEDGDANNDSHDAEREEVGSTRGFVAHPVIVGDSSVLHVSEM